MLKKLLLISLVTLSLFGVEIIINKSSELINLSSLTRDDIKETVFDSSTGLLWQDSTSVKSVHKNWSKAKAYCQTLSFAGHNDWFLPSIEQLENIVDVKQYNPAIKNSFKYAISSDYWSSTGYDNSSNDAWYVNFTYGSSDINGKAHKYYVRCAWTGQ